MTDAEGGRNLGLTKTNDYGFLEGESIVFSFDEDKEYHFLFGGYDDVKAEPKEFWDVSDFNEPGLNVGNRVDFQVTLMVEVAMKNKSYTDHQAIGGIVLSHGAGVAYNGPVLSVEAQAD